MGVDPGAKRCGYSIIEFDSSEGEDFLNPRYITSGIFGLSRDESNDETYSQYKKRLIPASIDSFESLFDEHNPDLIVFEFLPVSNVGAASGQRLLAFAVATVGQAMADANGISWTEITATTVKKQMTDIATASKAQVKNAVVKTFPELKERKYLADETDAIAIPLAWTKRQNSIDS